ncbi:MAG: hypothetical protein AMJ65_14395 [Phycisphaerae bacterium SG8_4]|nr:MAG: hypothetical protein AMJ65_14395 [Phycisphaerae bacterium SG8_4]
MLSARMLICAVRFFKLVLDLVAAGLVQILLWKVCGSPAILQAGLPQFWEFLEWAQKNGV